MRKSRESYQPRDARQGLFREKNLIEEVATAFAILRLKSVHRRLSGNAGNDTLSYERESQATSFTATRKSKSCRRSILSARRRDPRAYARRSAGIRKPDSAICPTVRAAGSPEASERLAREHPRSRSPPLVLVTTTR
jgi:hypothetical protein